MYNNLPKEFQWVNKIKKYEGNPIIYPSKGHDMIFNPAAAVVNNEVRLLCRSIDLRDEPKSFPNWSVSKFYWARSKDGINFELDDEPFLAPDENSVYKGGFEDPRLVWIEDEQLWVLTYTGVYDWNKTPGLIAFSKDLENWEFGGEQFPARAVCIIPKKINGKYYAYYGNSGIGISWSDDLRTWHTEHQTVLHPRKGTFDGFLCEGLAAPTISENGIFFMYNGACETKDDIPVNNAVRKFSGAYDTGYNYSVGWALFDINDPTKVIARADEPFLFPETPMECFGLVGYTIFASGHVVFNGKNHIYYGCNDTRLCVAIEE